jgi:hypothetical protein
MHLTSTFCFGLVKADMVAHLAAPSPTTTNGAQ